MNVEKPSARAHISQNTGKFIVERKQIYVTEGKKAFRQNSSIPREKSHTGERSSEYLEGLATVETLPREIEGGS